MADPDQMRSDVPDLEIRQASEPPEPATSGGGRGIVLVVGLLIVAAGVAAYVLLRGPAPASEPAAPAATAPAPAAIEPLGGAPAPVVVPPLDETDALVRELVRQLTSHPSVAAWLTTDGLLRNFVVAVANIADGSSPAVHLRTLRPSAPFRVIETRQGTVIDPRSHARYDSLAAAIAGIDPAGAAKVYATFKPRIQEAYRDLGHPDTPFDRTLEAAIVELLRTPVVEGPIRVEPAGGVAFAFANPGLESLSAAQRQLLRGGPDNTRRIQQALRAIAEALGIPAGRLPAPRMVR